MGHYIRKTCLILHLNSFSCRLNLAREEKPRCTTSTTIEQSLTSQEMLELKHWGLPELVLMRYRQKGIVTMFQWQMECLTIGNVLSGKQLDHVISLEYDVVLISCPIDMSTEQQYE